MSETTKVPLVGGPLDGQVVEDMGRVYRRASSLLENGDYMVMVPADGSMLIAFLPRGAHTTKRKVTYRRDGDRYVFVDEVSK